MWRWCNNLAVKSHYLSERWGDTISHTKLAQWNVPIPSAVKLCTLSLSLSLSCIVCVRLCPLSLSCIVCVSCNTILYEWTRSWIDDVIERECGICDHMQEWTSSTVNLWWRWSMRSYLIYMWWCSDDSMKLQQNRKDLACWQGYLGKRRWVIHLVIINFYWHHNLYLIQGF